MSDDEVMMDESKSSSPLTMALPLKPKTKLAHADSLPWVEKYRPASMDSVISHESIIKTLEALIKANRLPHLLLYGPPGTGKTSTILAIARQLFGPRYASHILELNASDERGIDVVREQIKDFASSRQLFSSGFKLIVLDEADAMTKPAQFALRRIIEKYTRNTRFCLICNYVNKIIPALQSRCTRFRFGPLKPVQVTKRLKEIAATERVALSDDGCDAIVSLSNGDMRRCLNILQQTHAAVTSGGVGMSADSIVDSDAVYTVTGQPHPKHIRAILNSLLNAPINDSYQTIHSLQLTEGLALVDIVQQIHPLVLEANFPPTVHCYLLSELSDCEYRLASGTSEKLQLAGLIGVFLLARQMVRKEAHEQAR